MASKHLSASVGDQLVGPITKAVTAALEQTFGVKVVAGSPEFGEGGANLSGDVTGIVGIVQDKLEGTFTACFHMEAMKKLIPVVLGDNIEITTPVIADAVGELTNMIFGQLKTDLNATGHQVRFGIPSVVTGSGHFISHLHQGPYVLIPFSIQGGGFQIHLAIHTQPVA